MLIMTTMIKWEMMYLACPPSHSLSLPSLPLPPLPTLVS